MFVDNIEGRGRCWCDPVIEGLLVTCLLLMPFMFGVVKAWSEEIVVVLVAIMFICFLMKSIILRRWTISWTWAYIPIAVFILAVVLQLIPMPSTWLHVISPGTVEQKAVLLADHPEAERLLGSMTISFYPHATRHDLRLVLAASAVFVVTFNQYRNSNQIVKLLGTITAIGAAVAFLCILQNVVGNNKIYWCVSTPTGTAHSGPFVNHSHYAQFVNLSLGAALGFILVKLYQWFGRRHVTPEAISEFLSSGYAWILWGALGMMVMGAATIFLSLSRGGMISMILAGAFTTLALSTRTSLRGSGWIIVSLALAAFICLLYVGFDTVYDRLGTLSDLHQAQGGRWQIVKDVGVTWTRFPILGTGLGTHEVVYPMFDRSTVAALASHAENEYAQAAEETGIVGLLALVGFGVIVGCSYGRILRRGRAPIQAAVYGLGFGLIAIMLHSLSDFGQHLPANAFLSVIFCALLLRLSHMTDDASAVGEIVGGGKKVRRWAGIGLAMACVLWGWVLLDADAARRSAQHWDRALALESDLAKRDWRAAPEEYFHLINHAQAAAEIEPDNVAYRYWLAVYRWRAVSQAANDHTSEALSSSEGRGFVTRIATELNEARACCPTFGATWSVLGQLERLLSDGERGDAHIRMGYRLAPCDPTACLLAARLDIEAGRAEQAVAKLRRAVKLDTDYYIEVAGILIEELHRPDLALEVAGEYPSLTSQLAQMLDTDTDFAQEVDNKLFDMVQRRCRQDDASAQWYAMLAEMQRRRENPRAAIESYGKALERDYGQVQWRLRRAQLMAEQGDIAKARHELQICLRLSPNLDAADRLLRNLSLTHAPLVDSH